MRKLPLFAAAMGGLCFGFQQLSVPTPTRPSSPVPGIEGLGSCQIDTMKADCWSMGGQRDARLSALVRNALKSSNQDIQLRFGERNVFAVVKMSQGVSANIQLKPQVYAPTLFLNQFPDGGVQMVRLPVDYLAQSSFTLQAIQYGLPGPTGGVLSSAQGSTAKIGDVTLTMGSSRPNPPNRSQQPIQNWSGQPAAEKTWSFAIGTTDNKQELGIQFIPLDKKGEEIHFVDKSGKPVTSLSYLEHRMVGQPSRQFDLPPVGAKNQDLNAYVQQAQNTVPGAFAVDTDVDPQYVGGFQLKSTTTATRTLGPFPIPPVGS